MGFKWVPSEFQVLVELFVELIVLGKSLSFNSRAFLDNFEQSFKSSSSVDFTPNYARTYAMFIFSFFYFESSIWWSPLVSQLCET